MQRVYSNVIPLDTDMTLVHFFQKKMSPLIHNFIYVIYKNEGIILLPINLQLNVIYLVDRILQYHSTMSWI